MSYTKIVPRDAPRAPYECELIDVDIAAIPFMLAALGHKAQKYYWTNIDEATEGRQMLAKQAASMLMPCGKEVILAVNQLYRQQETIMRGVGYTYDSDLPLTDPTAYNPMIPAVPAMVDDPAEPSMMFYAAKTMREVDNIANGTVYDDAPDDRNFRQQLADLLLALGGEDLDPAILAKLAEILVALA